MNVLFYNDLVNKKIPNLSKFTKAIESEHFTQADIKKVGDNLYRAKLSQAARLIFSFYRYENKTYCLVLEYLPNHEYEKSRFLSGCHIDESKIALTTSDSDVTPQVLPYLNTQQPHFYYLNKALSFDEHQQAVYDATPPVVIVGSAGSGKTALLLEKMKKSVGDVLYVSHSAYLVQNAREQYYSDNYANDYQESIDFLSFREYLETIAVPDGKEITRRDFQQWFQRQGKQKLVSQKVYEEFKGVLTGPSVDAPWLDKERYMALGIKQSLYAPDERQAVYGLFEKYLSYLKSSHFYDSNIISQQYLDKVLPRYDFVVIDEVQDLTNTQLMLILKSLREPSDFLLCGDANQIVHPNFFSWSKLKSLFFSEQTLSADKQVLKILHANYRNSSLVTEVANRILKLKHARFGSVDKESNFLVNSVGDKRGKVQLLEDSEVVRKTLNSGTARSTKFAVLVMHPEQKALASQWFSTPLVFSIEEAKGLEYESIILFNFVKDESQVFQKISQGVCLQDLDVDTLSYVRAKDKSDKSLETYKFYINSLYVAVTRAVSNLYLVEGDHSHPILSLLNVSQLTGKLDIDKQTSTLEEWQREAHRLEQQGKMEQAENIRRTILTEKTVPWKPIQGEELVQLEHQAFGEKSKKAQLLMLEYSVMNQCQLSMNRLVEMGFKAAIQAKNNPTKLLKSIYKNHCVIYDFKHTKGLEREVNKYGVNHRTRFNLTPLMTASMVQNLPHIQLLAGMGADKTLLSNSGLTAWQLYFGQQLIHSTDISQDIGQLYPLLVPDSISIQVDGKLEKLDEHTMYGFLLNVFISLWYDYLPQQLGRGSAMTAATLAKMLEKLPDNVLSPMKKKQAYISRYLSSNECTREGDRNKKLFYRIKRGHYVLNPALKFKQAEQWLSLKDRLSVMQWDVELPQVGYWHDQEYHFYKERFLNHHRRSLEKYRALFSEVLDEEKAPEVCMDEPA